MNNNSTPTQSHQAYTLTELGKKIVRRILRMVHVVFNQLVYMGGLSEDIAIRWLLQIYTSKLNLDWVYGKEPPHYYSHRIGMSQFTFAKKIYGPFTYYRGFLVSQVIHDGDKLLDIGCGDGFFTKRFYSVKCSLVDGIDIEPSAIQTAKKNNSDKKIRYHLMDAVQATFPEKEYDVIVWDSAIGHFSPLTLDIMLKKIKAALHQDGIFAGSESLGSEASDHLTEFETLDDFGKLFSKYFKFVEVYSISYKINDKFTRHEAFWRCANQPDRIQKLNWNKYYN